MNNATKYIVLALVIALFSPPLTGQIDLAGSWNCECVIEKEGSSLTFNDFCAYELKDVQIDVTRRPVVITDAYIETTENDETTQIPYTFDRENDILSFTFNETELRYKVLQVTGGTRLILRDLDGGSLLYLEKR